ncbi:MAG: copper resistance protein NlpE N-terminal domain-containing protein [Ignavibacterium sp.]
MKNIKIIIGFLPVVLLVLGCASSNQSELNKYETDTKKFSGLWFGELPCADCESISYELNISPDNTFSEKSVYNGKSTTPFVDEGKWEIVEGNILKIKGKNSEKMFLISDNKLIMLDREGKQITSSLKEKYVLQREKKKSDFNLMKKLLEDGIDFLARGNEPFWSLNIDFDKVMKFNSLTEISEFNTPAVKGVKAQDADVTRYHAIIESGEMDVTIIADSCTDSMSGENFSYSVVVKIKRANDKDYKEFKGCGTYIFDYRLSGKWIMTEMNGVEPDNNNLMKGLPVFEFKLTDKKFSGHAGCNNLASSIEVSGNRIRFGKLISTKMACPDMSLEKKVTDLLNDNSLTFKIDDMNLTLESDSGVKMFFKKSN